MKSGAKFAILMVLLAVALVAGFLCYRNSEDSYKVVDPADIDSIEDLQAYFHHHPDRDIIISAHRGGMQEGYPENCIASCEKTISEPSARRSSQFDRKWIGPECQVPFGTTTRPPPAFSHAAIARANASVHLEPSGVAPNSVIGKSRLLKSCATARPRARTSSRDSEGQTPRDSEGQTPMVGLKWWG